MSQCTVCGGHKWVWLAALSIPPYHDFFGVSGGEEACFKCNQEASGEPNNFGDLVNWEATALGGLEGAYTVFTSGNQTVVAERSQFDYWSWMRSTPFDDCPVCFGWGLFSDNGQVGPCIACGGGSPDRQRTAFNPLHAWHFGAVGLYVPRPYLNIWS